MTGFELMDKKMDMRALRNEINHSVIEAFEKDCKLTEIQNLALMRELLLEMATWQDQVGHLQQTIYSCLYLSKKSYYQQSSQMLPFIEAIHYITHTFLTSARSTYILRDEDITWPSSFDPLYDLEINEIYQRL